MNKLMKIGSRALAGALLCGSLSFGWADAAEAPISGRQAFREAITAVSQKPDKRIFRQDTTFFAPTVRIDLDFIGMIGEHALRVSGNFGFIHNDGDGNTDEIGIPFYIDQTKKNMTVYFNTGKKWEKFEAPSLAAATIDLIATPTREETEQDIALTKEVTVLRETDTHRTMLVKLDGNLLADFFRKYAKDNPPDKGTADNVEMQSRLTDIIDKGMRRSDIWYVWTVDKKNWQTVTLSCDLSSLVHEAAAVAMETPHEQWPPFVEQCVETLAYYSDLKTYTTFLNSKARDKLIIPREVLQAEPVNDLIPDNAAEPAAKK